MITNQFVAVRNALKAKDAATFDNKLKEYKSLVAGSGISIRDMRKAAKEIVGEEVMWDWDLPRTREGYYHYSGGMEVS